MKKILLGICYVTGNKYEPYDYIEEVLCFEDNVTEDNIQKKCNNIANAIAGNALFSYSWEEFDND